MQRNKKRYRTNFFKPVFMMLKKDSAGNGSQMEPNGFKLDLYEFKSAFQSQFIRSKICEVNAANGSARGESGTFFKIAFFDNTRPIKIKSFLEKVK
jgi:hypothetical protein